MVWPQLPFSTRRSALFAAVLITLAASSVQAQWVPTRVFSVRDGLAQSQVTALTQDDFGYLWIATQSGLSRFDGHSFTTFTRSDGLPDDVVTALAAGAGHQLWIGTDSGAIALWHGSGFTSFDPPEGGAGRPITGIYIIDHDDLLVGSSAGLWLWSRQASSQISSDGVRLITSGPRDRPWVLTEVVSEYLAESHELVPLRWPPPYRGGPDHRVVHTAHGNGAWWLATADGTIHKLGGEPTNDLAVSVNGAVQVLLPSSDGGLWIGSDTGLWRLDSSGTLSRQPLHAKDPSIEVHALLEDHEDNLWIGTWTEGLHLLTPDGFTVFDRNSGLSGSSVWSFLEDDEACVWMGTEEAGVYRWCPSGWSTHLKAGRELPLGRCLGLSHDGADGMWMATAGGVVHRSADGRIRTWTTADGLPEDYTRVVFLDRRGVLWAASRAGLSAFDGKDWQSWTKADGMPDDDLRGLAEDADGNLWIATHNSGVLRFDGTTFTAFSLPEGLPHPRVWCLTIDSHQRVWAGTDAGLWIHPLGNGHDRVIGAASELASPNILFLCEDTEGLMWTGTTRGVSLLDPEGTVVRNLSAHDGLTDSEAAENAVLLDSRGRMWLGMATGATRVDPRRLPRNTSQPPLVLERILVDGNAWHGPTPLAASLGADAPQRIVFPPRTTDLRFEFSALSFSAPEKVRYRFMLAGYDSAMSAPSDDSRITYRRLPPGSYSFMLTACNNDGVWSRTALEVPIELLPAWYQSSWFRIGSILLLLSLPVGWFLAHNTAQERRRIKLEQEVDARTSELAQANQRISEQNRQLTELSRTDPLTGLANRRALDELAPLEVALVRREVERLEHADLAEFHGISILMVDLDHFKQVNDSWGHEVGDRVLAAVAARLYATVREIDQVVRWGGEEFVILARSVTRETTLILVKRLLSVIAAVTVSAPDGCEISVGASIGFVGYPLGLEDALSADDWPILVDTADRLMYLAKDKGRGRAFGIVRPETDHTGVSEREVLHRILEDPLAPDLGVELVEVVA